MMSTATAADDDDKEEQPSVVADAKPDVTGIKKHMRGINSSVGTTRWSKVERFVTTWQRAM
jgi:hypothetical protein